MNPLLKAGDQVAMMNLVEPKMSIVSIVGKVAHCEYLDDFINQKVKLTLPIESLRLVENKTTSIVKGRAKQKA